MSQQNLLCCDIDSCNMEELVETKKSTERRSSVATRKLCHDKLCLFVELAWSQQKKPTLQHPFNVEEINRCRDMDINVATNK